MTCNLTFLKRHWSLRHLRIVLKNTIIIGSEVHAVKFFLFWTASVCSAYFSIEQLKQNVYKSLNKTKFVLLWYFV